MAGTMVNAMNTAAKMHKNPVFVNHNFPQESYAVSDREIISNFHDLFDYSGGYSTQIPGEPIILFVKVLFLVQMCVGLVDFWICLSFSSWFLVIAQYIVGENSESLNY